MKYANLITALRKGEDPLYRDAADTIEALMTVFSKQGCICLYCKHQECPLPDDEDCNCNRCSRECPCKDCKRKVFTGFDVNPEVLKDV